MRVFVAVAAAVLSAALPAGARTPSGDVLVLVATGHPVSTTFATVEDVAYTVTVSGEYEYDGTLGFGLTDCGHKDPESEAGWVNYPNVLVDGQPATCSVQPFSPTHSYTWTQRGTGRPFTFVIAANTYTVDDVGCLVVTVALASSGLPVGLPGGATTVPTTCLRLA